MNDPTDPAAQAKRLLVQFANGFPVDQDRLVEMAAKIRMVPAEQRQEFVQGFIDECRTCPMPADVRIAARSLLSREAPPECGNQLCSNGWIPGIRRGIECVTRCPECHSGEREPAAAG